jgi:hypothetical protein
MAQSVVYGPKQGTVKVPAGWAFVKPGFQVLSKDKKFNRNTHAWDPVDTNNVNPGDVIIRDLRNVNTACLDMNRHAVRIIE